jgi:hypothetical protein
MEQDRAPPVPLVLKPGALLTREWQGRIERVMVLEEGFAWNGKTHASVSAVAFAFAKTARPLYQMKAPLLRLVLLGSKPNLKLSSKSERSALGQ